jgi:hypothetical protein
VTRMFNGQISQTVKDERTKLAGVAKIVRRMWLPRLAVFARGQAFLLLWRPPAPKPCV